MQDIIPPRNGQQRGAIRPPVRLESPQPERIAPRESIRPMRSFSDVTVVSAPKVEAVLPQAEIPRPVVAAAPVPVVPVSAPEASVGLPPLQEETDPEDVPPIPAKPEKDPEQTKKLRNRLKTWGLIVAAIVVLAITAYVSIDTWLVNTKTTQIETANNAADTAPSSDDEGKDETKITSDILSNYSVAPDLPRALYIDKLDIAARVLPMSVNNTGSIQAPVNIYDSGWYTGSMKPGEAGAMFIDGHASGPTREGLFAYLDTLEKGDTLQVEKGDSTKLQYKVVHTEVVALSDIDMKKILLPRNGVTKGLNLMTCTGKWLPREKTYDHRVVVYTQQM